MKPFHDSHPTFFALWPFIAGSADLAEVVVRHLAGPRDEASDWWENKRPRKFNLSPDSRPATFDASPKNSPFAPEERNCKKQYRRRPN